MNLMIENQRYASCRKIASITVFHPQMSTEERSAFIRDADLVISFVVCNKLGLDVLLMKDKGFT